MNKTLSNTITVITIIIATIVLIMGLRGFMVNGSIPSESMEPTLKVGDKYLSLTTKFFDVHRGDIVVFTHSEEELNGDGLLIKRVIGIPGDIVEMIDGKVLVNGQELVEPYIKEPAIHEGTFKVPKDRYFLLGDNRNNSYDSSKWNIPYVYYKDIRYVTKIRTSPSINLYPEGFRRDED